MKVQRESAAPPEKVSQLFGAEAVSLLFWFKFPDESAASDSLFPQGAQKRL